MTASWKYSLKSEFPNPNVSVWIVCRRSCCLLLSDALYWATAAKLNISTQSLHWTEETIGLPRAVQSKAPWQRRAIRPSAHDSHNYIRICESTARRSRGRSEGNANEANENKWAFSMGAMKMLTIPVDSRRSLIGFAAWIFCPFVRCSAFVLLGGSSQWSAPGKRSLTKLFYDWLAIFLWMKMTWSFTCVYY